METHEPDKEFRLIGSRFTLRDTSKSLERRRSPFSLDIKADRRGREQFHLDHRVPVRVEVLETRRADRHLLLRISSGEIARTFLCGHDERHYFAAGVREEARTINDAMLTLQPEPLRDAATALGPDQRFSRHNAIFKRQGEWFFVRARGIRIDKRRALRNEPIRRGASKPHICQYLCKVGGKPVWFHPTHAPNGISQLEYGRLDRRLTRVDEWRLMTRDAVVYVKGSISHPDHSTLTLRGWHRVYVNGEVLSDELVFLD
jgi:hypothetical protein